MRTRTDEITEPQAEVLEHLINHVARYGFQPSLGEMAEEFGVTGKAISDRLQQLVRKGYLKPPPKHMDRCWTICRVKFMPVFEEGDPAAPPAEELRSSLPVVGPLYLEQLREALRASKEPMSANALADATGIGIQKVYVVLQENPTVFSGQQKGRGMMWELAPSGAGRRR